MAATAQSAIHPSKPSQDVLSRNYLNLLHSITAKDILAEKPFNTVITLRADTRLGEALKVLADANILSAPVVTEKEFIGFIDVLDIVGYLLNMKKQEAKRYNEPSFDIASYFYNTVVKDVVNFSKWDYPVYVSQTSTLNEILQAFDTPMRHFKPHRLVVLNEKSEPSNIISQSDIARFFATRIDNFSTIANKTVIELGIAHACLMVQLDSPVDDALWTLYNNRVSGLAIINPEGRLAGNLSASDLRGIRPEGFDMLSGSVLQFLVKGTESRPKSAVSCLPAATFSQVLSLFTLERVHRVYVVNEANVIRGVITLSDVLSALTFYQTAAV